MFKFHKRCPVCSESPSYSMDTTYEEVEEWMSNRDSLAQNVFTSLTPTEREIFITGICYKCQRRLFGE